MAKNETFEDRQADAAGGHRGEKPLGLPGDRLGQERLAVPGRAVEQHASRDAGIHSLEALGVGQEFDDVGEFLGRLIAPGHVREQDTGGGAHRLRRRAGRRHSLRSAGAGRPAATHHHRDADRERGDEQERHCAAERRARRCGRAVVKSDAGAAGNHLPGQGLLGAGRVPDREARAGAQLDLHLAGQR